jgi:hypothetical protein
MAGYTPMLIKILGAQAQYFLKNKSTGMVHVVWLHIDVVEYI